MRYFNPIHKCHIDTEGTLRTVVLDKFCSQGGYNFNYPHLWVRGLLHWVFGVRLLGYCRFVIAGPSGTLGGTLYNYNNQRLKIWK